MDGRDLHAVPAGSGIGAQIMRRMAFEEAHPQWRIFFDKDYRVWRAWRLLEGGEDNVTRYELRELLDALEARC